MYYKDAVGAFLLFDLTRADTFKAVEKWKEDLDSKVSPKLSNLVYFEHSSAVLRIN